MRKRFAVVILFFVMSICYVNTVFATAIGIPIPGVSDAINEMIKKHADWAKEFTGKYREITEENVDEIIREEIGFVFEQVLEDAGVYKRDENGRKGFLRFVDYVNS